MLMEALANDVLPTLNDQRESSSQRSPKRKRTGNVYGRAAGVSPACKPRKLDSNNVSSRQSSVLPQSPSSSPHRTPEGASNPPKPPRDISQLFEPPLHSGGQAKRRLVRTLTEPAIASSSTLAAGGSQSRSAESISPSTPVQHPSASASTRTYACKSRSFLIALPASKLGSLGALSDIEGDGADDEQTGGESQESYTDLRARWGVDILETEFVDASPYSSPSKRKAKVISPSPSFSESVGMVTELKTVSELRAKGESRRFHDEIGYLFEGLAPTNSVGLRRAGAMEIISKLGDPEFVRKAKASDFLGRAWDVLRMAGAGLGDQVLDTVLACFAVLAAREPMFLSLKLAHRPDFVSTLLRIFSSNDRKNDILAGVSSGAVDRVTLKKLGVRATDQAYFKILSDVVARSGLFPLTSNVTTRLVISHTFLLLPPSLFRPADVSVLCNVLLSELSLLQRVLNNHLAGRPLPLDFRYSSDCEIPSFEIIHHVLRLLDSFLLEIWGLCDSEGTSEEMNTSNWHDDDELAGGLVALCLVAEALHATDQWHSNSKSRIVHGCTEYALRVFVSLTQHHQAWNTRLLRQDFFLPFLMRTIMRSHRKYLDHIIPGRESPDATAVQAENESEALDYLCLALGICTNLVQGCEDAKKIFREIRLHRACAGERDCIRHCCCKNRTSALCYLTYVYVQLGEANEPSDPTLDFLRGHLAVLFGLLMRDDVSNQPILLRDLPGVSQSVKLYALLRQAREFVAVYATFRSRLTATASGKGDGGSGGEATSLSMWSITRQADSVIRDGKAESAAYDIVSVLETLYTAAASGMC